WNLIDQNQQGASFCWPTFFWDVGNHEFTVPITDNNAGEIKSRDYVIKINVLCPYCRIDIYYQNRTPSYNPLPPLTLAGRSITAGENVDPSQSPGPVDTGDDEVVFKAPEIDLLPGFTAGPNFDAI